VDQFKLVGLLLVATGVMDIAVAHVRRGQLGPITRMALIGIGLLFIVLGGGMALGIFGGR
jgi:hypothetical protein